MKKPTGRTGENGDRICRCIAIENNNMRKTHLGFLGVSSDEDDVANNVLLGSADEGGLDDEIDDDVVETRSVLNTSIESDTADNNGEPDDGMHPVGNPPPLGQRDVAENGNECNEGTPHPRGDVNISVALRRASSTAWADKTKIHLTNTRSARQLQVQSSSCLNCSSPRRLMSATKGLLCLP
jgi:hypothetical protein